MNPIRKTFNSSSIFPFDLAYRDTKSSQSELPDHLHDWHELVYIYSGKGVFFIDQTLYDMEQGNLFLIPGNTIHRAFPDRDTPVTSTAVFFSPILIGQNSLGDAFSYLDPFAKSSKRKSYKLECSVSFQQRSQLLLDDIHEEMQAKKYGYRNAIILGLQRFLLELSRELQPNDPPDTRPSTSGPLWMREILVYIDAHIASNIGLSALARRASVSPAHFSRVFKQLTGMNVTEYMTTKRIIHAMELLLETDHNVSYIASMCGFESLPHFHRVFKKIAGITPAAYKSKTHIMP
ncbi:AraC family transcriptional regulator [Paenibacillus abyssi]|uniref:HTH araC/xylS-type domain-containing protein n=1 Tax=Paenibacillus abyssi TaxID=1340531 RepID=A0A917FQP3_9BACL|nr:AraC family transcriptional regulator [Paenibacillus abyssi]GGF96337.1 hypothetical protein GCM10010916_11980 [Paenibacillus abyssi]